MPSRIEAVFLNEPSGRPVTLVMFGGAMLLLSIYAYGTLHDITSPFPLVMAGGFVLSGIAESLPAEWRRLAGALRVTAILLLLALVTLVLIAPEQVL